LPSAPIGGPEDSEDGEDGDEDDPAREPQNFFAGGGRSALSVENPGRRPRMENSTVRDILRKAAEAGAAPPPAAPSAATGLSSWFGGGGNTLGSDEVESTYIPSPDAAAQPQAAEETAIRHITFWRDGFSVEDGPLLRYDVPENARLLEAINTGHAPPDILNVQVGQPVELRVARRVNEEYVPPPPRPFGGSGNRLGAPVPEITQSMPGALPTAPTSTAPPAFELDPTKPSTSVQVRLADGTRLVARVNLDHTVADLRGVVNASNAGFASRSYTLGTAFPNRVLSDEKQTVKEAGLANAVVVMRWA